MEYDNEYDVRFRFELEKVLNYEDKIVEWHEPDDSNKMWVNQLSAADLSIWHCLFEWFFSIL